MNIPKKSLVLLVALTLVSVGIYAAKYRYQKLSSCSRTKKKCSTKKACLNDRNCQCYCSEKGDFRDKVANDKPVYVENDPNGVYCYCKQWDLDKYPGPAQRDE